MIFMTESESYVSFVTTSPKFSPLGFFNSADGNITVNLDEIYNEIEDRFFCNQENILIDTIIDVLLHEELHKRFDEAAGENHSVLNEQDEWVFKVINNWISNDKLYSHKF